MSIPERHLGLLPAGESGQWQDFLEAARTLVEKYLDVDAILPHPSSRTFQDKREYFPIPNDNRVVIAVARDEAFSFLYPENLELLEEAGARLVFFSPLRDDVLPMGTAGIILNGGFPEMYAARLSANRSMFAALQLTHKHNVPILAECGGLMYLTESIRSLDGTVWPMAGLLPGASVMTPKLTLGYRLAEAAGDGPLLAAGERVRGHEFHYSIWEGRPASLLPAFTLHPAHGGDGPTRLDGARLGSLWATYVHTHFLNMPSMAARFVAACRVTA